MEGPVGGSSYVARSEVILVAAPDAGFRHSLAFALGSEGFEIFAYPGATDAFSSLHAGKAACAVIDDDAIEDWGRIGDQVGRFARPVIVLVGVFGKAPELPCTKPLLKPFLGKPLIDAVRSAIACAR